MKKHTIRHVLVAAALGLGLMTLSPRATGAAQMTYNINTLAGKVAAVNATSGLQIRMSGYLQEEADMSDKGTTTSCSTNPCNPTYVLSSPLDGTSVQSPNVTVNQDTAAAPQNETSVGVDPNNASRVVAGMNDYATRTWTCTISGTPCSALGDGYSGTYYSNDGGSTWCCSSAADGSNLGTLIPGVERLTGGIYDAGGDPSVAFDSSGNVYYAGLGFNRTSAPNTVAVNKGTFDGSGALSWSQPVFINQTTSPSTLNDKEWIAVDSHASSPFRDRVYVTFTRFIFNAQTGAYTQSPIAFAYSSNGGQTFTTPQLISGNVLYSQGSRPVVGPDGTLYVFWTGSTRLATFDSTYMVKSTDGGVTFSKPVQVASLVDIVPPANAAFRVNSFPAAAVAPNGTVYTTWSTEVKNSTGSLTPDTNCAFWIVGTSTAQNNCHSQTVYSKSTSGGARWSAPSAVFAGNRTAAGYPVTQPNGTLLNAPAVRPADSLFPSISASSSGTVYLGSYVADLVSPWQTCAKTATPTSVGRIDCLALGNYINNARVDYNVENLGTAVSNTVTAEPINTRYQFGGGFMGDYTDIAVGSDNTFHALWTDTNNTQNVVWWYGFQFVPTAIHQEDIVTDAGNF